MHVHGGDSRIGHVDTLARQGGQEHLERAAAKVPDHGTS